MNISSAVKKDRVLLNISPIIVGIAIGIVLCCILSDSQILEKTKGLDLCNTMITVWATCLGFMITAVSILLAINNRNNYIEMFEKTGHYKTILLYYMSCCFHLLIALIIMLVIFISQRWSVFVFAVMCASTIDVLIILGLCLFFLLMLIIRINDHP